MNKIKIADFLQALISSGNTPSIQYYIFNRDAVIYKSLSGNADVGKKREVTEATTYNAYSVTKTYTALAILQLVEKGAIKLDDPAGEYIKAPAFLAHVSIRQLLTHTAGIPSPIPLKWIHLKEENDSFNADNYFEKIFSKMQRPSYAPGQKFAYSNLGYVLLGQLITNVSGMSYEQYIMEHIIKKVDLGSNVLGFEINDRVTRARGYHNKNSLLYLLLGFFIDKRKFMDTAEGRWKPFRDFYVNGVAYGGLIGNPGAFVKYIQALLQPECRLVSNESRKLMFTENQITNGKATGMCLSWFTGMLSGKKYFTHAGGGGGYYCEIRIYPEEGLGSVIFFNRTGVSDERILDKVDQLYFDQL